MQKGKMNTKSFLFCVCVLLFAGSLGIIMKKNESGQEKETQVGGGSNTQQLSPKSPNVDKKKKRDENSCYYNSQHNRL